MSLRNTGVHLCTGKTWAKFSQTQIWHLNFFCSECRITLLLSNFFLFLQILVYYFFSRWVESKDIDKKLEASFWDTKSSVKTMSLGKHNQWTSKLSACLTSSLYSHKAERNRDLSVCFLYHLKYVHKSIFWSVDINCFSLEAPLKTLIMVVSSLFATQTGISTSLYINLPTGDSVAMQTADRSLEAEPELPAFSFSTSYIVWPWARHLIFPSEPVKCGNNVSFLTPFLWLVFLKPQLCSGLNVGTNCCKLNARSQLYIVKFWQVGLVIFFTASTTASTRLEPWSWLRLLDGSLCLS